MCDTNNRQAGAEIDVSPEMVEAGVGEFLSYDSRDLADTPAREIVKGILRAALESAPSSLPSGRSTTKRLETGECGGVVGDTVNVVPSNETRNSGPYKVG